MGDGKRGLPPRRAIAGGFDIERGVVEFSVCPLVLLSWMLLPWTVLPLNFNVMLT